MGESGKAVFRHHQLKIEGHSRAGDTTWFRVDPPGLAFDVGRGAVELSGCARIFLSHGHLDHVLGLPFVLSHRAVHGLEPARVYAPTEILDPLSRFLAVAAELERYEVPCELIGLKAGDRVEVGRDLEIEAFAVRHGVPGLGYHLIRTVRHLAPEYQGRSADELARLRQQGTDVSSRRREIWLSYCGDTGREVFELEPRILSAKVLLLECTFLDQDARDKADRFGHLHFEDLVERRENFTNEAVLLHHLSRKHSAADLRQRVDEQLGELAGRVHLMMGDQTPSPEPTDEPA